MAIDSHLAWGRPCDDNTCCLENQILTPDNQYATVWVWFQFCSCKLTAVARTCGRISVKLDGLLARRVAVGLPRVFDTATATITRQDDDVLGPGLALLDGGVTQAELADPAATAGPLVPMTAVVAVDDRVPVGPDRALVDVHGALDSYRVQFVLLSPRRGSCPASPSRSRTPPLPGRRVPQQDHLHRAELPRPHCGHSSVSRYQRTSGDGLRAPRRGFKCRHDDQTDRCQRRNGSSWHTALAHQPRPTAAGYKNRDAQ